MKRGYFTLDETISIAQRGHRFMGWLYIIAAEEWGYFLSSVRDNNGKGCKAILRYNRAGRSVRFAEREARP